MSRGRNDRIPFIYICNEGFLQMNPCNPPYKHLAVYYYWMVHDLEVLHKFFHTHTCFMISLFSLCWSMWLVKNFLILLLLCLNVFQDTVTQSRLYPIFLWNIVSLSGMMNCCKRLLTLWIPFEWLTTTCNLYIYIYIYM